MGLRSPSRKVGMFGRFIVSDKVITAGVAIAATPFVASLAARLYARFGRIPGGITGALIVVAFILFAISGFFTGIISNIILGISVSAFVNAILSIPRVSAVVGSLGRQGQSG